MDDPAEAGGMGFCSVDALPESKMGIENGAEGGESVGSGGLWERFDGDLVAEAFELVDKPAAVAFGRFGVAAVEELFAELVIGDAAVEDVVGGGEDLVAGRDRRFGVAAAALDAVVA